MAEVPCRRCGLALEGAAIAIGICVSCIQAASFTIPAIPRPRYSADGDDDIEEGSEYDLHPE
jgi:hypothetical protein